MPRSHLWEFIVGCRLPACQFVELRAKMRNQFASERREKIYGVILIIYGSFGCFIVHKNIFISLRVIEADCYGSHILIRVCLSLFGEDVNKLNHIRVWTFLERGNREIRNDFEQNSLLGGVKIEDDINFISRNWLRWVIN